MIKKDFLSSAHIKGLVTWIQQKLDTSGPFNHVKPKCLYYEGFDKKCEWNYFLLEVDGMEPIFGESKVTSYEYLGNRGSERREHINCILKKSFRERPDFAVTRGFIAL